MKPVCGVRSALREGGLSVKRLWFSSLNMSHTSSHYPHPPCSGMLTFSNEQLRDKIKADLGVDVPADRDFLPFSDVEQVSPVPPPPSSLSAPLPSAVWTAPSCPSRTSSRLWPVVPVDMSNAASCLPADSASPATQRLTAAPPLPCPNEMLFIATD